MKKSTLVKKFLDNYINNRLDNKTIYLDDVIEINYSTIGKHVGKENVVNALKLDQEFRYRYNIMSNLIDYQIDNNSIYIVNVFHYLMKEYDSYNVQSATSSIKGQLFPFVFGGKYKFVIDDKKQTIKSITFDLEAELGNTYWAKSDWNWYLFEETKNIRNVKLDTKRHYNDVGAYEEIKRVIYEFLLIADTTQVALVDNYTLNNAIYSYRDSTYAGMGLSDDDRVKISMEDFIKNNKNTEHQNHHSCKIVDIKIENNKAEVLLFMFEPTKLGYKHLDTVTVYQPYYNERYVVNLVKKDGWKIKYIDRKAISKFEIPGYDTLEI